MNSTVIRLAQLLYEAVSQQSCRKQALNIEAKRLARDSDAVGELFVACQDRLERMVSFRLDRRLRGRIDVADVLQEAFIEVSRRVPEYVKRPEVRFYVWVRQITYQVLLGLHRRHLSLKRDAHQEVNLRAKRSWDGTSISMVRALCGQHTSPSAAAVREEENEQLAQSLKAMDRVDREVLALRHFEHLSNNEVAESLSLSVTATSNRYVRAVGRLSELMQEAGITA